MIKRVIDQQVFKSVDLHLSNLNKFHSPPEVVDRVSETQLHVGKNYVSFIPILQLRNQLF